MKNAGLILVILLVTAYSAGCGKQPADRSNVSGTGLESTRSDTTRQEVYRDHIRYTKGPEGLTVIDYTGEEIEVIIPSGIDDTPVIQIDDMAFKNDSLIKKIVIGEGISGIGRMAFANCESLESIEIPTSVTEIGEGAFAGCTSLKEISISEANPSFRFEGGSLLNGDGTLLHSYIAGRGETSYAVPEGVTEIGAYSFALCEGVLSVELPESVREIGDSAFYMCKSLKEVNLPSGLAVIDDSSFLFCESLEQAVIPESVTRIGIEAFSWCGQLKDFQIAEGNKAYTFEDGVLFNRDKTRLCAYMQTKRRETYVVPEGVTEIGEKAFSDCISLKNVVIPDSVTSFGEGVFGSSMMGMLPRSQELVLTVGENSAALEYARAANIDVEIR